MKKKIESLKIPREKKIFIEHTNLKLKFFFKFSNKLRTLYRKQLS